MLGLGTTEDTVFTNDDDDGHKIGASAAALGTGTTAMTKDKAQSTMTELFRGRGW